MKVPTRRAAPNRKIIPSNESGSRKLALDLQQDYVTGRDLLAQSSYRKVGLARFPVTKNSVSRIWRSCGASRLIEVLLLVRCGSVLILMSGEIKRELARIGWIGTEGQTADRTDIVTSPYAFAFSACHYRSEADFFDRHTESLH